MKPIYCQANSLGYVHAAELMRLSAERLAAGRASFPAYRVAAAVWTLTVPFAKGWDMVFVQGIGELANIKDRRNVGRAIKECAALGAIEWEPSSYVPPKGQPGKPSLVGLPGAPKMGSPRPPLTAAKTGSDRPHYLTNELLSNRAPSGADEHCSSLSSEGLGGLEGNEAHQPWDAEDLFRELDAALGGLDE